MLCVRKFDFLDYYLEISDSVYLLSQAGIQREEKLQKGKERA